MRGTELVTYLQIEAQHYYNYGEELDSDYVNSHDHVDIMQSVGTASEVLDGEVPISTASLIFRLQSGLGRSVSVSDAMEHRGLVLLTNDNRAAITAGTRGTIESNGDGLAMIVYARPNRYISAFTIPGVRYPRMVRGLAQVKFTQWPTTTIENTITEAF